MNRTSGIKINKSDAVLVMWIICVSYEALTKLYIRSVSYHFRKQFHKIYLCSDIFAQALIGNLDILAFTTERVIFFSLFFQIFRCLC